MLRIQDRHQLCAPCLGSSTRRTLAKQTVLVLVTGRESKFLLNEYFQLFRERLSYKREKGYATMSKVIMSNGGFYGCLSEPQGVSAWWKDTAQTRVFVLPPSLLLNHFKPQSSKA